MQRMMSFETNESTHTELLPGWNNGKFYNGGWNPGNDLNVELYMSCHVIVT